MERKEPKVPFHNIPITEIKELVDPSLWKPSKLSGSLQIDAVSSSPAIQKAQKQSSQ